MLWYPEGAYWVITAGFMSGGAGLIRYILRTGIHGLDTDFELLGHNGIVGVWGGGGCIEICHIVLALHCCLINSVPIASYRSSAE